MPKIVKGNFNCYNNRITSLDDLLSSDINGTINVDSNLEVPSLTGEIQIMYFRAILRKLCTYSVT